MIATDRHALVFLVIFMWWRIFYVYTQNVKTLNWPFFAWVRTRWWRHRFEYLCIPPKLLTDVRTNFTGVVRPIFTTHYKWKTPISDCTLVKTIKSWWRHSKKLWRLGNYLTVPLKSLSLRLTIVLYKVLEVEKSWWFVTGCNRCVHNEIKSGLF